MTDLERAAAYLERVLGPIRPPPRIVFIELWGRGAPPIQRAA